MKRLFFAIAFTAAFALPLLGAASRAHAFNPIEDVCDGVTDSEVCANQNNSPNDNPIAGEDGVLVTVIRLLSFAVGVASVIMIMLGGLKYITANGDANSIASAKNTILYAIIGLAVFAFSQTIILFVISRL